VFLPGSTTPGVGTGVGVGCGTAYGTTAGCFDEEFFGGGEEVVACSVACGDTDGGSEGVLAGEGVSWGREQEYACTKNAEEYGYA
jgi:hypothetical protein